MLSSGLTGKRLELLKETFPKIKKVAFIRHPEGGAAKTAERSEERHAEAHALGLQVQFLEVRSDKDFDKAFKAILTRVAYLWNPVAVAYAASGNLSYDQVEKATKAVGVQLLSYKVSSLPEIEKAFADMPKVRPHALLVLQSPLMTLNSKKIVELALKQRLPGMYPTRQFAEESGLMAYGPLIGDLYRRAATYVDKILKGAKPADLPVEQPTKFELIINLKTAKQIGLTIPPNVLARADKVIR
jgi:ABC-type uncharacterized transport system substrate-binding protein